MGLAMAGFGWSPDQFWRATMHEFMAFYEARVEMNRSMRDRQGA